MNDSPLFSSFQLGQMTLTNRTVMAPLTRSRAIDNIPNDLMADYYSQRASAGLIITEGTSPSPNGLGYARIPGLFSDEQVHGWKRVTKAVHEAGGRIFVQLMHTGRVSHSDNMQSSARILCPSPMKLEGEMYTDANGMQPYPTPEEMSKEDIENTLQEYVRSAEMAIEAGFDGVELHAANGYLLEQFLNANVNKRIDAYGGDHFRRSKFVLDVTRAVVQAIGKERVGMRLSPYGAMNGTGAYEGVDEHYAYLSSQLSELGLVYLHLLDHSTMGAPEVPQRTLRTIAENFNGPIIQCGGMDKEKAQDYIEDKYADLCAFGRTFLANPDLPGRMKNEVELNEPRPDYFYTPGAEGYTDYPVADLETV